MEFDLSFNKEEFKTFIEKSKEMIDNEKSFIHSKIDVWLAKIESSISSPNKKNQKRKEIIDFGKFIYCFNKDIEITDALCESPDFIISLNNKNIGIELTDLVIRENEKEKEGLLKKLFGQIAIELKNESNEYNGHYRIGFINDISFNKKNQIEIKSEIINLIRGKIKSGNLVKEFSKTNSKRIHIYNSEGWGVGVLDRMTVDKKIKKKEEKISTYFSEKSEEIWLLLMINGVSASDDYSHIAEDVINTPFKTKFGKIFIINLFKSELFELKTNNLCNLQAQLKTAQTSTLNHSF